jgi:hypothetical protein
MTYSLHDRHSLNNPSKKVHRTNEANDGEADKEMAEPPPEDLPITFV